MLNKHNKNLSLKMEMQEIRSLIFINSDKESIREFTTTDKREKDENLIVTLEAEVGIRQVFDNYNFLN